MLLPFWNYEVARNWSYTFDEAMLDSNIFCYGKSKSGKTACVAKKYIDNAFEKNRSIILYAPNQNAEYVDKIEEASKLGYDIFRIDAKRPLTDEDMEIVSQMGLGRILLCIDNADFAKLAQYNNADKMITRLSQIISDQESENMIHVILDGLCGNMLVQSAWLTFDHLKFCIITGDEIASSYWRYEKTIALCEAFEKHEDSKLRVAINSFYVGLRKGPEYIIQHFIKNIETIICTGVNHVAPKEHKQFTSLYWPSPNKNNGLSGRFCIVENIKQERAERIYSTRNFPYRLQDTDDIENSSYDTIAKIFFAPKRWVIEINGHIHLLNHLGGYVPAIFLDLESAKKWIQKQMQINNQPILSCEENADMVIYSVPAFVHCPLFTNEPKDVSTIDYITMKHCLLDQKQNKERLENLDQMRTEITLYRLNFKDIADYRTKYLLSILEVIEAEETAAEMRKDYIEQFGEEEVSIEETMRFMRNWNSPDTQEEELEDDGETPFEVPPEYRWKPYIKAEAENAVADDLSFNPVELLPQRGVLFLGGHQKLIKKLKQVFTDWEFISDNICNRKDFSHIQTIFFWTAHCSHSMQEFVDSRKSNDVSYIYVTATNINRLISEMAEKYLASKTKLSA